MSTATAPPSQTVCHRKLLEAAVLALSADNNQPWRFVSQSDCLQVYLDPCRTLPSNVNAMCDPMGLGARLRTRASLPSTPATMRKSIAFRHLPARPIARPRNSLCIPHNPFSSTVMTL